VSGNLTVSPGARKEGRTLGAGSLYLPSCLQHLAVKLTHYASEMGNAYSEDPPGDTMVGY
jgi:hypothetical protein